MRGNFAEAFFPRRRYRTLAVLFGTSHLLRRLAMLKSETESRSAVVVAGPSGSVADGQAAGSAWRGRTPLQGHIGFIGLGHMGHRDSSESGGHGTSGDRVRPSRGADGK